jgi:hypothetical protein
LIEDLENGFSFGTNNHPMNITSPYNLLFNYKNHQKPAGRIYNDSERVSFATLERKVRSGRDIFNVKCFICAKMGDFANDFPTKENPDVVPKGGEAEGATFLTLGEEEDLYEDVDEFTFHQMSRHVNPKLILLDNHSTTDILCNLALLPNIHCNAGTTCVSTIGTLRNHDNMWFSKNVIVNILSLSYLKGRYSVKYDSIDGMQFVVEQPMKKVIFKQSKSGMYYHNAGNREIVLVNTVKEKSARATCSMSSTHQS